MSAASISRVPGPTDVLKRNAIIGDGCDCPPYPSIRIDQASASARSASRVAFLAASRAPSARISAAQEGGRRKSFGAIWCSCPGITAALAGYDAMRNCASACCRRIARVKTNSPGIASALCSSTKPRVAARRLKPLIAHGWLTMHPSGAYLTFTQAGADRFA
jgi:hypothetical protein